MKTQAQAIERGAASMLIKLADGNITITHGTDSVTLAEITGAQSGTWDALWKWLQSQPGYVRIAGRD